MECWRISVHFFSLEFSRFNFLWRLFQESLSISRKSALILDFEIAFYTILWIKIAQLSCKFCDRKIMFFWDQFLQNHNNMTAESVTIFEWKNFIVNLLFISAIFDVLWRYSIFLGPRGPLLIHQVWQFSKCDQLNVYNDWGISDPNNYK